METTRGIMCVQLGAGEDKNDTSDDSSHELVEPPADNTSFSFISNSEAANLDEPDNNKQADSNKEEA
jgi:hypothetical protein